VYEARRPRLNKKEEIAMSTRYYAYISVLETDYARPEVRALFDEQFPDDYCEPTVEDGIVTFEDEHASYGRFTKLEDALAALDVAFDRKTPGYDEFPEMLVQYRPGNGLKLYSMLEGEYAILASYIRAIRRSLTAEEFLAWADNLSDPVPLLED